MGFLSDSLTNAYDRVYFDAELRQVQEKALKAFQLSPKQLSTKTVGQRVLQFFGLPSGDKLNLKVIVKGLMGWNESYSNSLNIVLAFIKLPLNLLITTLKFALNIAKFFTEFLPHFIARVSLAGLQTCKLLSFDGKNGGKTFAPFDNTPIAIFAILVGLVGLGIITAAAHLIYFLGCATTSPADTLRSAFAVGDQLAGGGIRGKLLGGFFAVISIATTACIYAILFPLAIKLLITQAPTVLPAIADFISRFVGLFNAQAGATVSAFFTTTLPTSGFLSGLGNSLISAATSLFQTFTLSFAQLGATPILAGIAGIAGITAGVVTPVVAAVDTKGEIVSDGAPPLHSSYQTVKTSKVDSLVNQSVFTTETENDDDDDEEEEEKEEEKEMNSLIS